MHSVTIRVDHEDLFSLMSLSALALPEVDQQSLRREND